MRARAKACTAVGEYVQPGRVLPLAERWNGTNWSVQRTAAPGGATSSGLTSVSCVAARACVAVGFSTRTATKAIAESWNGRAWALQPVGQVSSPFSDLLSVSCNSAVACVAVGFYEDSMTNEQELAEQYS